MADQNPFGDFVEKLGPGALTGAAIGGVGALILTLFTGGGKQGEGPGIFGSILAVLMGALVGGGVGFLVNPGDPNKGSPAPDGTAVTKRPLGLAAPPGGKNVELDYAGTIHTLMEKSGKALPDAVEVMDAALQKAGEKYRFILKTGEESASSVTFNGIFLPGQNEAFTFGKPVQVEVKDGKADYALAGGLSMLRMMEQHNFVGYGELKDVAGITAKYHGNLDEKQKEELQYELSLSALAANGKIDKETVKGIYTQAVKEDGMLNTQFLKDNAKALGLDKKRAMMFAPDGDSINIAMGTPDADGKTVQVTQFLTLDVKTMAQHMRVGDLPALVHKMVSPGGSGELNLQTLSAASEFMNLGLSYRQGSASLKLDKDKKGKDTVKFGALNDAFKKPAEKPTAAVPPPSGPSSSPGAGLPTIPAQAP